MKRWALIVSVLLAQACGGERNEERPDDAATSDSMNVDSVPLKGDSMMARDTAPE